MKKSEFAADMHWGAQTLGSNFGGSRQGDFVARRSAGARLTKVHVLCQGCRDPRHWPPLAVLLRGQRGAGQPQRTTLCTPVLSHPAQGAEAATVESASSTSLLQPCIGGGISFLPFSSCAPIRNLAGLFKDCFVKDIIQKGIIQFSIDHSHQEFIKAAWLYQSDREGMQETSRTQVYQVE